MPAPNQAVQLRKSSQPYGYKNSHNSSFGPTGSPTTQSASSPQEAPAEHPAARGGSTAQPASTAAPLVTVTPIRCLTPGILFCRVCFYLFVCFRLGGKTKRRRLTEAPVTPHPALLTHGGEPGNSESPDEPLAQGVAETAQPKDPQPAQRG